VSDLHDSILCATHSYSLRSFLRPGISATVDLKLALCRSRAPWPYVYACDMDLAFCRIEKLQGTGLTTEGAFKEVLMDVKWSSSTYSDHHRIWKMCPSDVMLEVVRKGRGTGGEWSALSAKYGRKKK
jgi:hypothetical protein